MDEAGEIDRINGAPQGFHRIEGVYTHFNRIELVRDPSGAIWCDRAWAQDIALHRAYIPQFRICAPVSAGPPPEDFVKIAAGGADLQILPLRVDRGWASVLANIIPNFATVIYAARSTDIAHSGGAGWAFPLSFYLALIEPISRFRWIIVIESMFWRVAPGERASLRRRIGDFIHRLFLARAVRRADIRIFTHDGYRAFFLPDGGEAMINPASWIEEGDIVSEASLRERHRARGAGGPLKALFAARLAPEKGLPALFAAVDRLAATGHPVEVGILGDGPMRAACEEMARTHTGPTSVRMLGVAPYGEPFFSVVRGFDAVLALSTSSEQPRVIFDAFSQGVPVIASATEGNLSVVNAACALTFTPGDGGRLADAIREAGRALPSLQARGVEARARAAAHTHTAMHQRRSRYIFERLERVPEKWAPVFGKSEAGTAERDKTII